MDTTFVYGKSTQNQRIENWWSKFKQLGMNYWIEHFKILVDEGFLDTSNELHIQCVRYCYMDLLASELANIMELWNTHYIRKNSNHNSPGGKPNVMYYVPEMFGSVNYLKPLDTEYATLLVDVLVRDAPKCDPVFKELFDIVLVEGHKGVPHSIDEADETLAYLLDTLEDEI